MVALKAVAGSTPLAWVKVATATLLSLAPLALSGSLKLKPVKLLPLRREMDAVEAMGMACWQDNDRGEKDAD